MICEKPRQIAAELLLGHDRGGGYIEDRLSTIFKERRLKPVDRHLLQELVSGCLRWKRTLDWLINQRIDPKRTPEPIRILLRLGAYQLFWLDRIPEHAAVHETVALSRLLNFNAHAPLVNAVLRGLVRERSAIERQLNEIQSHDLAVGYSHPSWLVNRWQKRFGDEDCRRLLEWNNRPPGTFVRINTLATTPARVVESWRKEGIDYDFVLKDWFGENLVFLLRHHPPLAELESFVKGWIYIQDPSTLLAVNVMNPQPGERILDLCAAPGGKTTYLAQVMEDEGEIAASDSAANRLKLLQQNCQRMEITSVIAFTPDELDNYVKNAEIQFDRILVDAPCSNTGVIRRRIDLRWRVNLEEVTRLATVQMDLLDRAWRMLKPDGMLVYSTCSLEPEENENLIEAFSRGRQDCRLEAHRLLLPHRDEVDGAFAAALRKNAKS